MMADAVVQSFASVSAIAESKSPPVKSAVSPLHSDGDPKAGKPFVSKTEPKSNNFLVATLGLSDSSQEAKRSDQFQETQRTGQLTTDTYDWVSEHPSLRVRFDSNHETGRVAISVIDAETDEVVREIPSEEMQRISQKIKENIGLIFDRNV